MGRKKKSELKIEADKKGKSRMEKYEKLKESSEKIEDTETSSDNIRIITCYQKTENGEWTKIEYEYKK